MLPSQDVGRLRQAVLLGLARQPLTVPAALQQLIAAASPERDAVLTVLALAGQQQRFQRLPLEQAALVLPEAAKHLHGDARPIIPEPARRALLRLANGVEKVSADAVLSAAVRRVVRSGFRLHPFDLPRLIGHIKGDARCLGLGERAYLSLAENSPAADSPGLLQAEITRENWTTFPKAHRVAFLRDQRRGLPAEARKLLDDVFKSEPAAMRGDLLAALEIGLGSDDLPWLESVATDRAESVRAIASGLIASVPGTPAFTARLAEAARCFARGTVSGILSRIGLASTSAVFKPPSTAAGTERSAVLAKLFDGFSVAEIAATAGLAAADVIAALPQDEEAVYAAFAKRAVRDGDNATMMQLAGARLASAGTAYWPARVLAWLADNLTAPVAAESGNTLLSSTALQTALRRFEEADTPASLKDDGTLVWTAAVLPRELLPSFTAMIAPLPPAATRNARDFADLVLALETNPIQQR
jgi:Family of unknown function (DUF5691)